MPQPETWKILWRLWVYLLNALTIFVAIGLLVVLFDVGFVTSIVVVFIVGTTIFLYRKAGGNRKVTQSRDPSEVLLVNYVTSHGIPVGGGLKLQSESLLFTPNRMEKIFRRKPFEISYEEIESIEGIPRLDDGFVATFTRAGIANRIQIELKDGTQELFVSSDLDSAMDKLKTTIDTEISDTS